MTWLFVLIGVAEAMLLVFSLRGRREGEDLVKDRVGSRREKKERAEKSEGPSKLGKAVDRAVAGRGFANTLAEQLARADLKLTVGEYLIISVTVGLGAALLFYILNRAILIPVGLIVGFFGPRIYVSQRQSNRLKAFDSQLGDAINLMVNSLRAGYSTLQAMDVISKEMPEPISKEFGRVVMELQLGVDFDTAMQHLVRRMPSPDLDLMITAMRCSVKSVGTWPKYWMPSAIPSANGCASRAKSRCSSHKDVSPAICSPFCHSVWRRFSTCTIRTSWGPCSPILAAGSCSASQSC